MGVKRLGGETSRGEKAGVNRHVASGLKLTFMGLKLTYMGLKQTYVGLKCTRSG